MFNPYPYDDPGAVNYIAADTEITGNITTGLFACAKRLAETAVQTAQATGHVFIALDGYVCAPLEEFAGAIGIACASLNLPCSCRQGDLFKDEEVLHEELLEYLPEDRKTDPVLLYGKVYHQGYGGLFDKAKVNKLEQELKDFSQTGKGALLVYGNGILSEEMRSLFTIKVYIDITPKKAVLMLRSGAYGNLGQKKRLAPNFALRRAYYVDFEAAGELRGKLLAEKEADFYVAGDNLDAMRLISVPALHRLFNLMINYPLRCRPVYLEGIWGGFYIKRLRHLPDAMKNCAWVFDLIPMEVSIVADMGGLLMEFPFYSFVQLTAKKLLGEKSVAAFGPYFPIRFNYDDTFHSGGSMSIQVHPDQQYVKEQNNEFGRQDESYYIIDTAQGAKTYLGWKKEADVEDFITKTRQAENTGQGFSYDDFVYSKPSVPGMQFLIPAGTIHASGRNQLILEIGSLTIGSYTYKMYDYLRKDAEGNLRPIHTYHGNKVLKRERKEQWVEENLVQKRRILREENGFTEYIVGEHDLIYFSLRNVVFGERYEDDTIDRFHVLVLVDGEQVLIRSKKNSAFFFRQKFLETVVIPACLGPYEVINEGTGIVTIHKTLLKDDFESSI
jgi:mannose-6-phosphate isomerase class I